jgi:hypothetical protein
MGYCPSLLEISQNFSEKVLQMIVKTLLKVVSVALVAIVALGTLGALTQPAYAQQPDDLIFYEGNGCSQDIVFTYNSFVRADDNCKKRGPCKGDNDEARSLRVLTSAKRGTQVRVYDSPDGRTDDDYAIINILDPARFEENGLCLRSFQEERNDTGRGITLTYVPKNGLDGKVSRVKVIPGS